jgi:TM2 domain-containing membrane protein YozV
MDAAAETCRNCGVEIVTTPQTNAQKKNPRIAAVASVVLPGLGQIYTEQTRKGIALVIVAVFLLYVIVAYRTIASELADFLYIVILLYSAYDSYNTAKSINLGDI